MIYEEHGLTTKIAFNSALKRAGIEITSYVAPLEITTDAICTIDTTEHDKEIQAEAITEFAEWLCEKLDMNVDKILEEYERSKT